MKLKIKELREEFIMTQKELAQKIGNEQRNVSNWENGTSEPDCETILKIAQVFDVSIDELFGKETYCSQTNYEKNSLHTLLSRLNKRQLEALKSFLATIIID